LNKGKTAAMAVIEELCANNFLWHPGAGADMRNIKDYKRFVGEFYDGLSDMRFTIDDMLVEGDKVAVRFTITGTHTGASEVIVPTNKKVTLWGIGIDRISGGKVVESWERYDTLGYMQQLGLVLRPEKG
jgi:predicted ester cyclase